VTPVNSFGEALFARVPDVWRQRIPRSIVRRNALVRGAIGVTDFNLVLALFLGGLQREDEGKEGSLKPP
jgi:hypothetical protein